MHPHLIDWFRNPHLQSDATVVEKRWTTAKTYSEGLDQDSICSLIRLFLFAKADEVERKRFEDHLLSIDSEFPVTGNDEELRLMAGVVMVTTFTPGSDRGLAFALGLRAARYNKRHIDPAQPEIIVVAENFLNTEAERKRPNSFDEDLRIPESSLDDPLDEADELNISDEESAARESEYKAEIKKVIGVAFRTLENQISRLAEESALLWWVMNEYSSFLDRLTAEISASEYAIVSAAEAAERTHLIPPPRSAHALLVRALKPCTQNGKTTSTLEQLLTATPSTWRSEYVKTLKLNQCGSLLPILTGLAKCDEFGSAAASVKVIPKLCPGVDVQIPISPSQASFETYCELMFIKALHAVERGLEI